MTSGLHELIKEEKTTDTPTRVTEVRANQAGEGDAQKNSPASSALLSFSFSDNSRLSLDQVRALVCKMKRMSISLCDCFDTYLHIYDESLSEQECNFHFTVKRSCFYNEW